MTSKGVIYGINGPVVYVKGRTEFKMAEMVYVGNERLVGEVIRLSSERTTIQVYEETTGVKPGEPVVGTGAPISVTLAPGILDNIFDGIERPLAKIAERSGSYISRGISAVSYTHLMIIMFMRYLQSIGFTYFRRRLLYGADHQSIV